MHTFKLAQIRQKPKSSKSNADYANEWANEESDSIYFVNQTKMNQTHIANDEEKKKYINSMLLFQCGCKSDALFVCLLIWMYFFINCFSSSLPSFFPQFTSTSLFCFAFYFIPRSLVLLLFANFVNGSYRKDYAHTYIHSQFFTSTECFETNIIQFEAAFLVFHFLNNFLFLIFNFQTISIAHKPILNQTIFFGGNVFSTYQREREQKRRILTKVSTTENISSWKIHFLWLYCKKKERKITIKIESIRRYVI